MITALTFDDGYLEHYQLARLLNRFGIRATFFIITHLQAYEGRPLLMRKPELIKEIWEMGHEVGSHTCTHPQLQKISLKMVEEECMSSKSYLTEQIGDEVVGFAYPYGVYNSQVLEVVRRNYAYARGMGSSEDRWNVVTNDTYRIGGMGVRHLAKIPLKMLGNRDFKYLVLVFHTEPATAVAKIVTILQMLDAKFATLSEIAGMIRRGC